MNSFPSKNNVQSTRRKFPSILNLLGNRIQSRFQIIKDKYFNIKQIFKFFLPFIITLILLPLIIFFLINKTYETRIITNLIYIPEELKTGVVIINYEDINNSELASSIFNIAINLYNNKKITNLSIFALNKNNLRLPVKNKIQEFFKEIPSDKLNIDISINNEFDVCKKGVEQYNINKFLLISYKDNLNRIIFTCNQLNIYTKGYYPIDSTEILSNENNFNLIMNDIMRLYFSPNN